MTTDKAYSIPNTEKPLREIPILSNEVIDLFQEIETKSNYSEKEFSQRWGI